MMDPSRALQEPGAIARPVLVTLSFLILFGCLDAAASLFETFPRISLCYLPAGLSLAVVLAFGASYALLVSTAHLLIELLIRPQSAGLGDAVIYAVAVGAIYLAASVVLSQILGRTQGVQTRPALAVFLLGGVLTSICFSLVTVLDLWATGLIEWQEWTTALTHGTIGTLLGIFSVTPFLILVVAPQFERLMERLLAGDALRHSGSIAEEGSRFALAGVGGGFALFGLVTTAVVTMNINDQFVILCLLLPPFLGVALIAGLEAFSAAAFGAVVSSSLMQWDLQLPIQQTIEFQALVLLVLLNGMLIGTIVSEKKLLQGTDTFREAALDSVSYAAQTLAGAENWESYFSQALKSFGEATDCTYVCLFEAWPDKEDYTFELLPYDWASSKYSPNREQLGILNRIRSRELTRRIRRIPGAEVWRDPPVSSTHEEQAVWTASGIRFTLVVPLKIDRVLWGCLVLGRTEKQKDWTRREIEAVRLAVKTLGSLFASARTAEQIQQLSQNIRGDLWISSPDGHRRIGLSPQRENAERKDPSRLPESWMETVHAEDIGKVESALSGRGDFDLEYRIVLSDKSIRWVRDRGFVVRNEIGQVSRVIGMAEDVTSQKNTEEKLEQSVDLLAALFDKLGSGVLVEDEALRVSHVNKEFFELLKIDEPSENVAGSSSGRLFAQSKISARRIEAIRSNGIPIVDEECERNGSILNLSYVPITISRLRRYHLWQFREVREEPQSDGLEHTAETLHSENALLRETYQAVKNDLQVIYGVLKLQSARVQDRKVRSYFVADQTRVMAIAMVHERLSKADDLGTVDFPGYARNLTEQLIRSYFPSSQDVEIRFDVAAIPMHLKIAIPCGLIINELVTNALRYAFPDQRQGEILIRFGQLDEHNLRLTVRDNGVGFPEGLDFKKASTLGMMLVTGLTEQLGGTIAMRNHSGTEFNISFPSDDHQPIHTMTPAPAETYQSQQAQRVS